MASSPVEINDLPNEILCYIFSKLDVDFVVKYVMNVCLRWKSIIAENKTFWNDVQFVINCDNFIDRSYLNEGSARYGDHLNHMTLQLPYVSEERYQILIGEKDIGKVSKLRSIKFTEGWGNFALSVDLLIRILDIINKACKDIEKIEFFQCCGAMSREFFSFLRESCSNIQQIRYDSRTPTGFSPFCHIAGFGNLNTLVVYGEVFRGSDLYLLAEGCKHLKSLWILNNTSLTIDDVLCFIEKKKNILKELGLGITLKDCILEKLKECLNLEVFFATRSVNITDDCIKSFARQSRLKYCSLHNSTFQRKTVLEVAGRSRKPDIFQHLGILDLTGYNHYCATFFNSWNDRDEGLGLDVTGESHSSKSVRPIEIIFNNPVHRTIWVPSNFYPSEDHWMYRYRHV